MRVRALILGGAVLAAVSVAGESTPPVPIYVGDGSAIFPKEWRSAPVKAQATMLSRTEINRSWEVAQRAMSKYPDSVLRRNLHSIYFVSDLRFYGLPYGGTNSVDTVYLANRGESNGFTNQFLEESFHHEFSSILLRNYAKYFREEAWKAASGSGYRGDGTQALRDGTASTRYERSYHEIGFLAQYATASIEEDFNMMAEGLFSGNPQFWQAIDAYPRLRAKCALAIEFYHRIDSQYDEEWFRSLVE